VLAVTNLSGTLSNGNSFKLFTAVSYDGAFTSIIPASPAANLRWATNGLVIDGVLRVASTPTPPPVFGRIALLEGTNLAINASGGVPYEPAYLLSTTNIALPVTNWLYLATNTFAASGSVSFTNVVPAGEPQRYYLLQVR
jgi:hypothetical protein